MANDTGAPSAPVHQADEKKSGNVSGAQVEQMLLKREARAIQEAKPIPTSVVQEDKTSKETAPTVETSKDTKEAEVPETTEKDSKAEETKPDEPAPEDVLSQLSPELKEKIDKRIGKEVAKRKAMESEIARLQALVNTPSQKADAPATPTAAPIFELSAENPLANTKDVNEVIQSQKSAEEAKFWAQEQLDNDELKEVKVGDKTLTRSDLKAIVRNSERLLTKYVPERMQYLQAKAQTAKVVSETFPWVNDQSSREYAAYKQILAGSPAIARRPDAEWIAAVQVTGLVDIANRKRVAGQPTAELTPAKPRAPASQVGGSGAPGNSPREATATRKVAELEKELTRLKGKKGVSGKDAAEYLRMQEMAR